MLFNSKINPVMFIAEVGSNHEGNFLEAKRLVKNASKSKADVVKRMVASYRRRKREEKIQKLVDNGDHWRGLE